MVERSGVWVVAWSRRECTTKITKGTKGRKRLDEGALGMVVALPWSNSATESMAQDLEFLVFFVSFVVRIKGRTAARRPPASAR